MLGPNDLLNPDIPDPDADLLGAPADEQQDDEPFGEGDDPEAVPQEPGTDIPAE